MATTVRYRLIDGDDTYTMRLDRPGNPYNDSGAYHDTWKWSIEMGDSIVLGSFWTESAPLSNCGMMSVFGWYFCNGYRNVPKDLDAQTMQRVLEFAVKPSQQEASLLVASDREDGPLHERMVAAGGVVVACTPNFRYRSYSDSHNIVLLSLDLNADPEKRGELMTRSQTWQLALSPSTSVKKAIF